MRDSSQFDPTAKFVNAGGSAHNKATYLSAHVLLQTSQDHEPHFSRGATLAAAIQ